MLSYEGTYRLEFLRKTSNNAKLVKEVLPSELLIVSINAGVYISNDSKVNFHASVLPFPIDWLPSGPKIDGPYLSDVHMMNASLAYNLIIMPNSQKATAIALTKFSRRFPRIYDKYFTDDFIEILPEFLSHTFIGEVVKGNLKGVHFQSSDVRILKHIEGGYNDKIQYGVIEKVDPLSGSVNRKKEATTFWPNHWSIEKCIKECSIAWSNKVQKGNDYFGKTTDNIEVKFCFRNRLLKTAFPIRN